ncbi:probable 28S ribosomal protein S6, mitochondrial [Leptopilina heterotoma]|uniref:probable 28S ribosomal protein S6, mitochondrial n=1 Tax=Leptopilina heterotoma TaxID=63436 RepID=UPI001CA992F7|nr:probable 28S ribosomal protein S6, mitochondrial [Leptopilina heterotoma]
MPTYEMPLLLKIMSKPDLTATLKRVAQMIFDKGGFIRKMENLGRKPTAYRISSHGRVHKEANFFIFYFDLPPSSTNQLHDEYNLDIDIVKNQIITQSTTKPFECTLDEEMLPAPYRPSVQKLMKIAEEADKKKNKYKFKYNSGLSYYPFQR